MTMPIDETLAKLNALNDWLKVIYDREVQLSDLLANADISPESIDEILNRHLSSYLDGIFYFLRNMEVEQNANRRNNELMLRHYGLITGKKENLYSISHEFGIAGERIRQLIGRRINQLKNEKFRSDFEQQLVRLADEILKLSD